MSHSLAHVSSVSPEGSEAETVGHVAETREALVRNITFGMTARVGYLLSRIMIPPFVLARVGLSAYSLWSAVFLIVGYVGMTSIGFSSAYIKLVAEFVGKGENAKANSILSTGLVACGLVCATIFAVLALNLPTVFRWLSVPAYLHSDARYVILLVVGIHSCVIVFSVFTAALAGCQRIRELQCIWVVHYLLEASLIFLFVGTGHGVRGLADAFAIGAAVSVVLQAVVAMRATPWLRVSPRLASRESWRTLRNFGAVVQFGALVSQVVSTAERIVAAPLIGLDALGLLDIGAKLPRMASSIPDAFNSAFLPASAYLHGGLAGSSHGRHAVRQLYLKGSRYMILTAGSLQGFMATAAVPVLSVWIGRIYPGTALLMTLFALSEHTDLMTGPGTSMLRGLGRPWQEFAYSVPNLLLAIIMIPLSRVVFGAWTAVGLGTAIVLAQTLAAIGFIIRTNRIFEVSTRQYFSFVVLPSLVPYVVGGLIAIPLSLSVAATNRWFGAGLICVGGMLYLILLAAIADRFVLAKDEQRWFRQIISQQLTWGRLQLCKLLGTVALRSV